jgi:DNA-directed RNA polymerase, mitochondrial
MLNLVEVQQQLEQESLDLGMKRYRDTLAERGESDLPPGQRLIRTHVREVADAIKQWLDECAQGVPSRSAGLYYFLQELQDDVELVAFATMHAVIQSITTGVKLQHVARTIGVTLEDQVNHEKLREQEPGLYRQLQRKIKKSTHQGYRHVVLHRQQKFAGIKTIRWGTGERVRVGALLIEIMQETVPHMFTIEERLEGRHNTPLYVVPTEWTLEWLRQSHARCEFLTPHYLPMVVKPRAWSNPFNGGYLDKRMRGTVTLVKGASTGLLDDMKNEDMSVVYRALNAMQDTGWAVNQTIYRIMREVWDGGGNLGGLPCAEDLELPARDFTEQDAQEGTERFKRWKARAAEVYEKNVILRSKRVQVQQKLWVAERMANFERFHFVHALDFRGRAYAVGAALNPQGDDAAKALLQFAEGKPLGLNGAFWLAVHGANCFGVDKVSFEERTAWVQEHHDQIVESADNPLDGSRFWTQADNPWQFLAFCIEWRNLYLWTGIGNAVDFVSHLPVGMDGACNGLQNFSAMLRDEVGGKATNLIPSDKPSDIYTEVARVANELLPLDSKWRGKITRKLTKRNTMTVPYAVTEFGMRDQLMAEFKKLREEPNCDPVIAGAGLEDAILLADVNYRAIGSVVIAARAAMDWLKEAARVVAADQLPVQWRTPSGFVVVQDYREMLGDRINFTLGGRRVRVTLERRGDKLDRRKQASGISPNFVHSLDAAHLQRTVGLCLDHGVTHFSMIHDSYGTHAADVQTMSQLLRQAFVEQYSGDVLGDFRSQMVKNLKEELAKKIPPTPPTGTLELTDVMQSDYFFA